ncbi:glycosyltransferase family 2 protein [Thioalkalivibrio thiocyanodenitrificans]|uniref:glycosyltransferase family 2 protein n=1 Tax=Thioalkalivibrio thiocyanodenitrificans TaxID=243063 RepID=UPI0003643C25|nr:glycosyltransferase [Thioalkalivibrio thiocyanodenitrificans]
MTEPRVSVIIPAWNASAHIERALASVHAQAVVPPPQVIVVDDASTDDTVARVRRADPDATILRHERNLGPAAARNRGLTAASAEFIAFLDADDLWPTGKLTMQLSILAGEPAVDIVTGRTRWFRDESELAAEDPHGQASRDIRNFGNTLIRRRAFTQVGLLDERLRYSEDQDWFLRADEAGLVVHRIPQITLYYRMHAGNMTRGMDAVALGIPRTLHRAIQRRRRAAARHKTDGES